MPRPIGTTKTPSYCLHKSSGRAYVTLRGKPVYLGQHGTEQSKAMYNRVVGEWMAAGCAPSVPSITPPPDMTVTMLVELFWTHAEKEYPAPPCKPGKRPSGELGNYWDVLKPLNRLYGPTPAAAFGPVALEALRGEMVKLDWCRNYINRQVHRIKYIFRWAVSKQHLKPAVAQALASLKALKRGRGGVRETEKVKPVPGHILKATLHFLSPYVRSMVELQLATGMRPGELCSMRTRDLDTTGALWVYRPEHQKNEHHDHDRVIRIGKRGQAILRPYLKPDLAAFVFSPADAEAERHKQQHEDRETPVQPSQAQRAARARRRQHRRPPHDHYTVASYRRAIARACDRADAWAKGGVTIGKKDRLIPRWHPHHLRHNFATVIRRDFGAEATLILLGDRTTRMVDIYSEKDAQIAERIMAQVG
jgi:integrase